MLVAALECAVWVLTYVHPIYVGTKLCRHRHPNRDEVSNVLLALIGMWVIEALDATLLSTIVAARGAYCVARIVLCLYLVHPKYRGATVVYRRFVAPAVEYYGPLADELVVSHIDSIRHSGVMQSVTGLLMSSLRLLGRTWEVSATLVLPSAVPSHPPANLPRQLSPSKENQLRHDDDSEFEFTSVAPDTRSPMAAPVPHGPSSARYHRDPAVADSNWVDFRSWLGSLPTDGHVARERAAAPLKTATPPQRKWLPTDESDEDSEYFTSDPGDPPQQSLPPPLPPSSRASEKFTSPDGPRAGPPTRAPPAARMPLAPRSFGRSESMHGLQSTMASHLPQSISRPVTPTVFAAKAEKERRGSAASAQSGPHIRPTLFAAQAKLRPSNALSQSYEFHPSLVFSDDELR